MSDTVKIFAEMREQQRTVDERLNQLETNTTSTLHAVHATSLTLNGVAINATATYSTGTLRGTNGVASNAKGILATIMAVSAGNANLYFSSSDDTPDANSQHMRIQTTTVSQLVVVPLGMDGGIKILCTTANTTVTMRIIGYWT